MDAETLEERAKQLLAALPADGALIRNTAARTKVGDWAAVADDYWTVRNYLRDQGKVRTAKGWGGQVGLVLAAPAEDAKEVVKAEEKAAKEAAKKERDLYPKLKAVLESDWVRDQGFDDPIVELTAGQGRKQTGGLWTRPDIVVVAVRTYHHLPGKFIEVVTFEVKPEVDIMGVFEAAAHSRAGTRSYLIMPKHKGDDDKEASLFERIMAECRRFNIGLIEFDNADDYDTWNTLWEPMRNEPNPEDLDAFLGVQLPESAREKLKKLVR